MNWYGRVEAKRSFAGRRSYVYACRKSRITSPRGEIANAAVYHTGHLPEGIHAAGLWIPYSSLGRWIKSNSTIMSFLGILMIEIQEKMNIRIYLSSVLQRTIIFTSFSFTQCKICMCHCPPFYSYYKTISERKSAMRNILF